MDMLTRARVKLASDVGWKLAAGLAVLTLASSLIAMELFPVAATIVLGIAFYVSLRQDERRDASQHDDTVTGVPSEDE